MQTSNSSHLAVNDGDAKRAQPLTRAQWLDQCAARFKWAKCSDFSARDCAIHEFNIRCREEPMDCAPEQPADRWPDPSEAADDAMREWENTDE